jgi:ribosomal protein S18 acetylase RimI-like enzyme
MATLTESLTSKPANSHLRPFDARRDLAAVADLVELCFADTLDESGKNYVRRMRAASRSSGSYPLGGLLGWSSLPMRGYIWQQDERLVGNVSLIPFSIRKTRNYLIANVAVHPDFRRQGIARNLTIRAVEYARRQGAFSVWLHVREENDAAIQLYQSSGFTERMRRTSWVSRPDSKEVERSPGVRLGVSRGRDWELQRQWLSRNYPPEVTWQSLYSLEALRPGFWGAFYRLFSSFFTMNWSAWRGDRLVATVGWQASLGSANYLWLAAPPEADEPALRLLLLYARSHAPSQRPLELDYPAWQSSRAIEGAGFVPDQTLIWMEQSLTNP